MSTFPELLRLGFVKSIDSINRLHDRVTPHFPAERGLPCRTQDSSILIHSLVNLYLKMTHLLAERLDLFLTKIGIGYLQKKIWNFLVYILPLFLDFLFQVTVC